MKTTAVTFEVGDGVVKALPNLEALVQHRRDLFRSLYLHVLIDEVDDDAALFYPIRCMWEDVMFFGRIDHMENHLGSTQSKVWTNDSSKSVASFMRFTSREVADSNSI